MSTSNDSIPRRRPSAARAAWKGPRPDRIGARAGRQDISVEEISPPDPAELELVRIDAAHWLIHDHGFAPHDASHLVACVEESDDFFDVAWVRPGIPLPTRYLTAADILDDFARWRQNARRDSRPIPIASFPPRSVRDAEGT